MLTIDVNNVDWASLLVEARKAEAQGIYLFEVNLVGKKNPPTGQRTALGHGVMGWVLDVFSVEGQVVVRVRLETSKAKKIANTQIKIAEVQAKGGRNAQQ